MIVRVVRFCDQSKGIKSQMVVFHLPANNATQHVQFFLENNNFAMLFFLLHEGST